MWVFFIIINLIEKKMVVGKKRTYAKMSGGRKRGVGRLPYGRWNEDAMIKIELQGTLTNALINIDASTEL